MAPERNSNLNYWGRSGEMIWSFSQSALIRFCPLWHFQTPSSSASGLDLLCLSFSCSLSSRCSQRQERHTKSEYNRRLRSPCFPLPFHIRPWGGLLSISSRAILLLFWQQISAVRLFKMWLASGGSHVPGVSALLWKVEFDLEASFISPGRISSGDGRDAAYIMWNEYNTEVKRGWNSERIGWLYVMSTCSLSGKVAAVILRVITRHRRVTRNLQ